MVTVALQILPRAERIRRPALLDRGYLAREGLDWPSIYQPNLLLCTAYLPCSFSAVRSPRSRWPCRDAPPQWPWSSYQGSPRSHRLPALAKSHSGKRPGPPRACFTGKAGMCRYQVAAAVSTSAPRYRQNRTWERLPAYGEASAGSCSQMVKCFHRWFECLLNVAANIFSFSMRPRLKLHDTDSRMNFQIACYRAFESYCHYSGRPRRDLAPSSHSMLKSSGLFG